jgi:hypothetical protein
MKKRLKQFISVLIISAYSVVNCFGDVSYLDIANTLKNSALRPVSTGQNHDVAAMESRLQTHKTPILYRASSAGKINELESEIIQETIPSYSQGEYAATKPKSHSLARRFLERIARNRVLLALCFIFMPSIVMAQSAITVSGTGVSAIMPLATISMPFFVSASLVAAMLVIVFTTGYDFFIYRPRKIKYDERPDQRTKYIKHGLGIAFWVLLALFVHNNRIKIAQYSPMNRNSEAAQADVHGKWRSLDNKIQVLPDGTQVALSRHDIQSMLAQYQKDLEGVSSEINIKDPDPRNQASAIDALRHLSLYGYFPGNDTMARIISLSVSQPGDDESIRQLRYAARQTLAHLGRNQADTSRVQYSAQEQESGLSPETEELFENQRTRQDFGQGSAERAYNVFAEKIGIIMDSTYGSLALAIAAYIVVIQFLWNRKRVDFYTIKDDKTKHKIAFWALDAIKFAAVLAFLVTSGMVSESRLQRRYISSYFSESPERGLVIPVESQQLAPDFLNLDNAQRPPAISPFNAIGVVLNNMINTRADRANEVYRSSGIRLLAQLIKDVSIIPEQDLDNILSQLFGNESFMDIFRRFVGSRNSQLTDISGRRIADVNADTIKNVTITGKQNLLREFSEFYLRENFSGFNLSERQAALRFFWALRSPDIRELSLLIPLPEQSDIEGQSAYIHQMSLFAAALQQSRLSESFSQDVNFLQSTISGLRDGKLSLVLIPRQGSPYRNEILDKLSYYPLYELPNHSLGSEAERNVFLSGIADKGEGMEGFLNQITSGDATYIIVRADSGDIKRLSDNINIGNDSMRIIVPEISVQDKIFSLLCDLDRFIRQTRGYGEDLDSDSGFSPWDLDAGIINYNQAHSHTRRTAYMAQAVSRHDISSSLLNVKDIKRSDVWFWMFAVLSSGFYAWYKVRHKKKTSDIAGEPGQSVAWNKGAEQAQVSLRSFITMIGIFFALHAAISFIGFNNYRKRHERSLAASSEAYNIETVSDFISAVRRPELKYLLNNLSIPSATETLRESIANLARLNDINAAPWLIQLAIGHPEEEIRILARSALEHIRQAQKHQPEDQLDEMAAYFTNNPMTPEMLERFHGLFLQVFETLSESEKAAAVKLHLDAAPSYLVQTENQLRRISENLNDLARLSEASESVGRKGLADYIWHIARTSPERIANNIHAIAFLESEQSIAEDNEYIEWKQKHVPKDADLSDVLQAVMAALFVIGVIFYIKSYKSPEKALDRINADPKNSMPEEYLEKLSDEREPDNNPKITRGLLRAYIRLKIAGEQAQSLEQARLLRNETPAEKSIASLAEKRAMLISQVLARRYLRRTSLITHLEKAHRDIMEEYPGCFDILHALYRSEDTLDNISNMQWLVPVYRDLANQDINSRFGILKRILAIMALDDTGVQVGRDTIISAVNVNPAETDLVSLKESNIMPRDMLVRMGCSRHTFDVRYHSDKAPRALTQPVTTTLTEIFSDREADIWKVFLEFGESITKRDKASKTASAGTTENKIIGIRKPGLLSNIMPVKIRHVFMMLMPVMALLLTSCATRNPSVRDLRIPADNTLIADNRVAALTDFSFVRDEQSAVRQIQRSMDVFSNDRPLIQSEGLRSAPGIVRAMRFGPEAARSADRWLTELEWDLEGRPERTPQAIVNMLVARQKARALDNTILPGLIGLVGHPNETVSSFASKWLIRSKADSARDSLISLLTSPDPNKVAHAAAILGYRKEAVDYISALINRQNTPYLVRQACLDALTLMSSENFILLDNDITMLSGILTSINRLPDNAWSSLSIQVSTSGADNDRSSITLQDRAGSRAGIETEKTQIGRINIPSDQIGQGGFFGQNYVFYNYSWVRTSDTRWNISSDAIGFIIDLAQKPFRKEALDILISIATTHSDPVMRKSAVARLGRLNESESAVETLFDRLADIDPHVQLTAWNSILENSSRERINRARSDSHARAHPGPTDRLAGFIKESFWQIIERSTAMRTQGLVDTRNFSGEFYAEAAATGEFLTRIHRGENILSAGGRTYVEYLGMNAISEFVYSLNPITQVVLDTFVGRYTVERRVRLMLKQAFTSQDINILRRYLALSFALTPEQKDLPILYSMLRSDDAVIRSCGFEGLSRLNAQLPVQEILMELNSDDMQVSVRAAFLLGFVATPESVYALEAKVATATSYVLRREAISSLSRIALSGPAREEAKRALIIIEENLRQQSPAQGGPKSSSAGSTARALMAAAMLALPLGAGAQTYDDAAALHSQAVGILENLARQEQSSDIIEALEKARRHQQSRESEITSIFVMGKEINLADWQANAEDIGLIAQVLDEAYLSYDVDSIKRQIELIRALSLMSARTDGEGALRSDIISILKSCIYKGSAEPRIFAVNELFGIDSNSVEALFENVNIPLQGFAMSPALMETKKIWRQDRSIIDENGQRASFDDLMVWSRQNNQMHPTILWFLNRNNIRHELVLDIAVSIIQDIGTLPGGLSDRVLIEISEDDRSILSGYAVKVLSNRALFANNQAEFSRIILAIERSLQNRFWPVRAQAINVLYGLSNKMAEELALIEPAPFHGRSGTRPDGISPVIHMRSNDGTTGESMMHRRADIYRNFNMLRSVLERRMQNLTDPDREPVPNIRKMAERILIELERAGGIRFRDLSISNRGLGQERFDDMANDPGFIAQEEAWSLIMLDIIRGAFISSALDNVHSSEYMDKMLNHNNPNVRGMYAHALKLIASQDRSAQQALLDSLNENIRDVFNIKLDVLRNISDVSHSAIRLRLIELLSNRSLNPAVRANAAYGLEHLISINSINSSDADVFSTLVQTLAENSSDLLNIEAVNALKSISFINNPGRIDTLPQDARHLLYSLINGMNHENLSYVYIDGSLHSPELVLLKALLPFDIPQMTFSNADKDVFDLALSYAKSRLGQQPVSIAQDSALSIIRSANPEKRLMGYKCLADLARFMPENINMPKAIIAIIGAAVNEYDYTYGARDALFNALRNIRTNWQPFAEEQLREQFTGFALNIKRVLESANDSERSDIIRVFGKRPIQDPNGVNLWPAAIADFYLDIVDNIIRRRLLSDANELEYFFNAVEDKVAEFSGFSDDLSLSLRQRNSWASVISPLVERLESLRTKARREAKICGLSVQDASRQPLPDIRAQQDDVLRRIKDQQRQVLEEPAAHVEEIKDQGGQSLPEETASSTMNKKSLFSGIIAMILMPLAVISGRLFRKSKRRGLDSEKAEPIQQVSQTDNQKDMLESPEPPEPVKPVEPVASVESSAPVLPPTTAEPVASSALSESSEPSAPAEPAIPVEISAPSEPAGPIVNKDAMPEPYEDLPRKELLERLESLRLRLDMLMHTIDNLIIQLNQVLEDILIQQVKEKKDLLQRKQEEVGRLERINSALINDPSQDSVVKHEASIKSLEDDMVVIKQDIDSLNLRIEQIKSKKAHAEPVNDSNISTLKSLGANMDAQYVKRLSKYSKVDLARRVKFIKDELGIDIGNGRYIGLLLLSEPTLLKKKVLIDSLGLNVRAYLFKMSEEKLIAYASNKARKQSNITRTRRLLQADLAKESNAVKNQVIPGMRVVETRPKIESIGIYQKLRQSA